VSADQARVEFDSRVDATLQTTYELARALIGAHQAAMSLIVAGDGCTPARLLVTIQHPVPALCTS
jgi:hypothetical protein